MEIQWDQLWHLQSWRPIQAINCNDFPQLSKANIRDRHHYAVGASKPCCPPPPPPLPLVPSDTMVARNLASFASQHAFRDVHGSLPLCITSKREDWNFEYPQINRLSDIQVLRLNILFPNIMPSATQDVHWLLCSFASGPFRPLTSTKSWWKFGGERPWLHFLHLFYLKICLIPSSISAIFCRAVMAAGHGRRLGIDQNEGSAEVCLTQFNLAWCGSRFQLDSIIAK